MAALLLLALPIVFYATHSKPAAQYNFFDRTVAQLSRPILWAMGGLMDTSFTVWRRYIGLVGLHEENVRLVQENLRLSGEVTAREEAALENMRLRQLAGLREQVPSAPMILAAVTATSPSPLFRSIRLSRGAKDGVTLGAAVLTRAGVVGRVAALSDVHADVMLLVDPQSSTDVLVQRTRARARVRGEGIDGEVGLEVQYLARTSDVAPGDLLITSGLSKTFAKGLPVGRVVEVERRAFGLYQLARVMPAVDFERLEEVLVVSAPATAEQNFEAPEPEADASPSLDLGPAPDAT